MNTLRYCPKCGASYDSQLPECPYCHEPNPDITGGPKKEKPQEVLKSIGRQLGAFATGWLGLDILATLVILAIRGVLMLQYSDPDYIDLVMETLGVSMLTNGLAYLLLFIVLIVIIWPALKPIGKQFTKLKPYVKGISYGVLILALNVMIGMLYEVFHLSVADNANETAVTTMMTTYPFWSVLAFVIIGPLCEEMTYRLGLFSAIRRLNRYAAYAVVIVLFASIHFDFQSFGDPAALRIELLNLPFYAAAGGVLCLAYDRGEFATSATAHITNNLVSFVISVFSSAIAVHMF